MNRLFIPLFAFSFFPNLLSAQSDTVPPVIECVSQASITTSTNTFCQATVRAVDLITAIFDDNAVVESGIRKICTGTGFPENSDSLNFFAGETGLRTVEVWARDMAGNTSSCKSKVIITDNGFCDPAAFMNFRTPGNAGIDSVTTRLAGQHCLYVPIDIEVPGTNNWWSTTPGMWMRYGNEYQPGYDLTVTPAKNINPLNGVSTNDLLLIARHLLGIQPFDSPWKYIAADANQDGKVSTYDIVILRKLILGITTELPNGKSWRFIPKDYVFPDPSNPFQPAFPERIEILNTDYPVTNLYGFTGIKIGDVDFSADPNQ